MYIYQIHQFPWFLRLTNTWTKYVTLEIRLLHILCNWMWLSNWKSCLTRVLSSNVYTEFDNNVLLSSNFYLNIFLLPLNQSHRQNYLYHMATNLAISYPSINKHKQHLDLSMRWPSPPSQSASIVFESYT